MAVALEPRGDLQEAVRDRLGVHVDLMTIESQDRWVDEQDAHALDSVTENGAQVNT